VISKLYKLYSHCKRVKIDTFKQSKIRFTKNWLKHLMLLRFVLGRVNKCYLKTNYQLWFIYWWKIKQKIIYWLGKVRRIFFFFTFYKSIFDYHSILILETENIKYLQIEIFDHIFNNIKNVLDLHFNKLDGGNKKTDKLVAPRYSKSDNNIT